ncbi:MAG: hypothetical protein HYX53_05215 [Chloroflexi bacterium]|nr:hypothetical protein [Chloroflexota bacterium]
MPVSQHRLALVGILLAIVAILAAPGGAVASSTPTTDPIAIRALRDEGTYQGECWTWVQRVVLEATGRQMGFDYRMGFFDAGAIEVPLSEARAGDIVQIALDADTSPSVDYRGLHTAIIVHNNGDGTFDAIDSNQRFDGVVRMRLAYDPAAMAVASGLQLHVYRISGTPGGKTTPRPVAAEPPRFASGDRVIVKAGPEGLNLRPDASPTKPAIGLLKDGTVLTVLDGPVSAAGRTWLNVATPLGNGWVATDFVVRDTPSAPGSGAGGTEPLRRYRNVVPQVSSES